MAEITKGTEALHGIVGTASNLVVQSYSVDRDFENKSPLKDESGNTVGVRYDGVQTKLTIEGIATADGMPSIGDTISFTAQTDTGESASISAVVETISEKGTNTDYVKVTITSMSWEYLTLA